MSIRYKLKLAILKGKNMRGDRLRQLRENEGISQEELAKRLKISEAQIWRIENTDAAPRGETLINIADYYGVSTDYLLGRSDSPAMIVVTELNDKERRVIADWRRGKHSEAARTILNDEKAHNGA